MKHPIATAALTASLMAASGAAHAHWQFSMESLAKPAAAANASKVATNGAKGGAGLRLSLRVDGAPIGPGLSPTTRVYDVVVAPGKPTVLAVTQDLHYCSAIRPVRARDVAAERDAVLLADPAYATDAMKARFAALNSEDEGDEGPDRVVANNVETGVATVGLELVLTWGGDGPVGYTLRQVEANNINETTADDGTRLAAPVFRHAHAQGTFAPAQGAVIPAPEQTVPDGGYPSSWDKVVLRIDAK